jgi:putative FmdB family regulatory protein
MPIYTFQCQKCEKLEEHLVKFDERDDPREHEGCGGEMVRGAVELFRNGPPAFQTQAVLANGDHIRGHFGKEAAIRVRDRK